MFHRKDQKNLLLISPLLGAVALSGCFTGCSTAPAPATNPSIQQSTNPAPASALSDPIIGTNGIATLLGDGALSLGTSYAINAILTRSPQHAAQIKADLALIKAGLELLQTDGSPPSSAAVNAALVQAKVQSAEVQSLVVQLVALYQGSAQAAVAHGLAELAYVPGLLNAIRSGIAAGLGE